MKKLVLVFTNLLFITLSIIALLKANKFHEYDNIHEKEEKIVSQEKEINELKEEISNYKELIENSNSEDNTWKENLTIIQSYL